MRRRTVEVVPEPRRFRPETVPPKTLQPSNEGLRVSIAEAAVAKQLRRMELEARKLAAH